MSVPCPINSVSLPARNEGSSEVRLVRYTTTSNEPLAASYRLSSVIDFKMTGWLRTDVVSANGFLSCGSRCTADNTTTSTTTAMIAATILPSHPVPGTRGIVILISRGSRFSRASRAVPENCSIAPFRHVVGWCLSTPELPRTGQIIQATRHSAPCLGIHNGMRSRARRREDYGEWSRGPRRRWRPRSRSGGCLMWVVLLILILIVIALLFGGFQKGTKSGSLSPPPAVAAAASLQ